MKISFKARLTMFPYVFPILIITPVEIMFKTNFVAVPAFILVLPVTTSAPVTASIMKSTSPLFLIAEGVEQATPTVTQPLLFANAKPPRTYGVRPDAAMPMRQSFSPSSSFIFKSLTAASASSSAPSMADRSATSPPAINPTNCSGGAEYVGGISDASRTPNLPDVPAPM